MELYGLIGKTLSHSFSKNYFEEKFTKLGLTDYSYELFPLENIEEIKINSNKIKIDKNQINERFLFEVRIGFSMMK